MRVSSQTVRRVGVWRPLPAASSAPLAAVAGLFAVLQVALGPARIGLGWDETVYVSQVAPDIPAAYFSAPRARGMPLLVAPVAGFTSSTAAIRIYLLILGAIGLCLAYRIWLAILPRSVVVLAAAVFATLWPTLFYGSEVMPNFWIALLAVAVAGAVLRYVADRRWRWVVLSCVGLAAMALIRPSDAAWFAVPIVVGGLAIATWRSAKVWLIAVVGLAVGITPWVVEAYVRFGGLGNRLHAASVDEGGLRPHLGFLYEARALYGPLLCRPCSRAPRPMVLDLWWVLLPVAIAVGVIAVRRTPLFLPLLLAAACAAFAAAPYLFLVDYAAPRFLLPAYALAALPVAHLIVRLVAARRQLVLVDVAVVLALFMAGQAAVTTLQVPVEKVDRINFAHMARQLHALGVFEPCVLEGPNATPVAYYSGCASVVPRASHGPPTEAAWVAYAHRINLAIVIDDGQPVPSYARRWRKYQFRDVSKSRWVAYLPP